MSRKKQDQVLQQELETDEQWDEYLSKPGLIVTEAYSNWCGSCKAVENIFKKIKMELADPLLMFAIANADKISFLEDYRGRCEPCFLFYAGKELVAVVRGANAPVLIKTINEQLAAENKVLKGEAQRKPITDPFIEKSNKKKAQAKSVAQIKNLTTTTKPITICIIKPDMIAKGKKDEIIQKIKDKGYEIVEHKEVKFTEEMAKEFYKNKEGKEHFEDLIKYMTSDVSCVLALSKPDNNDDVINSWRNDIGPTDLEAAKKHPDSLRALYATDQLMNAIHGSDSHESAMRELGFFFPHIGNNELKTQRTLALIRPTALAQHKDAIIKKIKDSGFQIAMAKTINLDQQSVEEFYAEQKDKPIFKDLVHEMTSGPVMALCLVKEDAISSWRNILGPAEKDKVATANGTLRHDFDVATVPVNSLHGASTPEQAKKEIEKFFPIEKTIALIKPGLAAEKRSEIEKKIQDSGFIIAAKKSEKLTEEIAKDIYKGSSNKEHYNDLVKLMTSGETEVLVLSRENAIQGWREMIGSVDPAKAKAENPNSLRALYGVDVLNNAVHGPSDKKQAEHEIKLLFGEV